MASQAIEIVKELRALEAHYSFKVVRSGEEQERFMRDYVADLRDFDLEAIRIGCMRWRTSLAKAFPTSGQLIQLIRSVQRPSDGPTGSKAWEPISDAEYNGLSLREKIRHHQIMAHRARREAGPMWANGRPLDYDEMPAKWHHLHEQAANHVAEAKRLKDAIASLERRAGE
jgi:hypothetical protein